MAFPHQACTVGSLLIRKPRHVEDAVGYSVNVTHLAPTTVGDQVTARARLVKISGRKIICVVDAVNSKEKIGEGTQVQVLVRKDQLERFSNSAN